MKMLLCGLVLVLCGAVAADDKKGEKIDPAKLVGKWEQKGEGGSRAVFEFTSAGKVTRWSKPAAGAVSSGTYKVDGAALRLELDIQLPKGTIKAELDFTVLSLTATELVVKDEGGGEQKFERVKDKK